MIGTVDREVNKEDPCPRAAQSLILPKKNYHLVRKIDVTEEAN